MPHRPRRLRLAPASLFGRLLLLLLAGLGAALALSAWLTLTDRGEALYRVLVTDNAERIANLVELLDGLDEGDRARVVDALDLPPLYIRLDLAWAGNPAEVSPQAAALAGALHAQLGDDRPLAVSLSHGEAAGSGRDEDDGKGRRAPSFFVQVGLADGGTVSFLYVLPRFIGAQPVRLLAALALVSVIVLAVSVLAVRGLTRPLARLAGAARELGTDLERPPLPETGPVEVRDAAIAFNDMQARLRRQLAERDQLLAAVSHDLKTPLARLRLRLELIGESGVQARALADLADLETTVADTLDFLRAGREEATVPVAIGALAEALADDAADTGAAVEVLGDGGAPLPARPRALRRCLQNLLDNALRYGNSDGEADAPVEIVLHDAPQALCICIRDRGPGLPAAELERVFEPFRRLEHSRSRATGGTGLGLSIARAIARGHGGELTLANRSYGPGLEARLTLPRRPLAGAR